MANIRLKELVEAIIDPKLVARNKESGKLVYFKTPQAKDAAVKAGSHLEPKGKKGDTPKAAAKPNDMFGGDYKKDRGNDSQTGDSTKSTQSKSPSKVKIGDVNVTKDKQTGIVHLQDTNTYGNRPFTNTSILPKDIPTVIKHLSQPNPIKFRITSVNSIYKDTFVTKSNDGITITDKSKKYWPTVRFKSNELPNLIKYFKE
jgi:hypothetical protein